MKRQRLTINASDLTSGARIIDPKDGRIYRLGPPKKKNVNKNVVNHCQLYGRNGRVSDGGSWWNMTNLRDYGFKLYVHTGQLPITAAKPAPAPAPYCEGTCGICSCICSPQAT
jgi:hypothetical protein